jgi:hypothetical protein
MTLIVYRDIACADGAAAVAETVFRVTNNGFTFGGYGTGTGGEPFASRPAAASTLATALRTAPGAWVSFTRGTRAWSLQRNTAAPGGANPDYRAWKHEYTASGVLTSGTATAPPRNASTSQYVSGNFFRTSMAGSSTGSSTINEAMKLHVIVDDAGPSWLAIMRRTPFPVGNVGACGIIGCDALVNPVWPGNTDPVALINAGLDTNAAHTELVGTGYNNAWIKYGLSGSSFTGAALHNPGNIAGSAMADQGGSDILVDAQWVCGGNLLGTSTLFQLLQPGRTPVVGVDLGATLNRAAFWNVAVLNDGIALVS